MTQAHRLFLSMAVIVVSACGSASPGGLSPDPACDRYLACASQTMPATFASELAAYGPASSCWQASAASQACSAACASLFDKIADRCICRSDEACPRTLPVCDTIRGHCAECATNDDCNKPLGASGYVSPVPRFCRRDAGAGAGSCVSGCAVDADCPSETPLCSFDTDRAGVCGVCKTTEQCPAGTFCYKGKCG